MITPSKFAPPWFTLLCLALLCSTAPLHAATHRVAETLPIDSVPSWFPVGFCLLTHGDQQYVAYYNEDHEMIVAQRSLSSPEWNKVTLPSKVGWDSHNYITMAFDDAGQLHLTGNMHVDPLIYFRTTSPGDITTLEPAEMVGEHEDAVTYPRFLRSAEGQLLFMYRDGGSGRGRRFINAYDHSSQTWSRHVDVPIFDGKGEMNAYPTDPTRGPDGMFHTVWVWRDNPDCATNNHLSYARSPNLKDWESAGGEPLELPLTVEQQATWVDPIPSGGGIINGCQRLTFDAENRPIVSYHKSDDRGFMQIFVARFEDGDWQRHPITEWEEPVPFSGRGSMGFIGIRISGLEKTPDGNFTIRYRHKDYGSGRLTIDGATLQPTDQSPTEPSAIPRSVTRSTIDFDGISTRIAHDSGSSPAPDIKYVLRWETLPAHHDRPRDPPLPPASQLTLIKLEREN